MLFCLKIQQPSTKEQAYYKRAIENGLLDKALENAEEIIYKLIEIGRAHV